MPAFIVAALVAGAASGALGFFGAAGVFSMGAFLSSFATSAVLGGIAYALREKPQAAAVSSAGRTLTIRQPIAPRQVIFGRARVGGTITYLEVNGHNLYLVITLAGHVCDAVEQIYFNDELVPLDGSYPNGGGLATGTFAGAAIVEISLGDEAGQPFAALTAASNGLWTDAHRQTGCCKIAVHLGYTPTLYPNGIPNITAVVRGAKVRDERGSPTITAWSQNPALLLAHYLSNAAAYGVGADYSEIDLSDLAAAANTCDEQVELAGSPTTYESRYTANGTFLTSAAPKDVIGRLLAAMAGRAFPAGSRWHIFAGGYEAPTVTLDEGDLAGPIRAQALLSRRDSCNGVKGVFTDPNSSWQPTDFPPLASATYMAQDNGERFWRDLDLTTFVTSGTQAQRLAKIELLRTRQGYTAKLPCKLTAWAAMTGRTVAVTNTQFGWSPKNFDIQNSRFTVSATGELGVELTLRETASAIYDWSTSEESAVDIAPNYGGSIFDFPTTTATRQYALISAGDSASNTPTAVTEKHFYDTDGWAAGTSLSTAKTDVAGAGNSTRAIIAGGRVWISGVAYDRATAEKYTYVGDTVAAATSLDNDASPNEARRDHAAVGNETYGIFTGGVVGGGAGTYLKTTAKYTYASDVAAAGSDLASVRDFQGAAGDTTAGIIAGGFNGTAAVAITDKYTYATDARAAATNLGGTRQMLVGCGPSTHGIYGGGFGSVATTEKYTYAGDTVATSTSLATARQAMAAASDDTTGAFCCGRIANSGAADTFAVERYDFASDGVATGISMRTHHFVGAGTSSDPGGF